MRYWLLIALFSGNLAAATATTVIGGRPGYLQSIEGERNADQEQIVLLVSPEAPHRIAGRPLVDAKLSREFQEKYNEKFGITEAERNYNSSNQFTLFDYPGGRQETVAAHEKNQHKFANFMLRRLGEHHADQYAKSNPDVRPIYEMKDKISNVQVQVRKGYKARIKYSYSGNFLEVRLENPYDIESKLKLQMVDGKFFGKVERSSLNLSYPLSKKTTISAVEEMDRKLGTTIVGSRKLTKTLSTSLQTSINTPVDRDDPLLRNRHDMVLLGFTLTE